MFWRRVLGPTVLVCTLTLACAGPAPSAPAPTEPTARTSSPTKSATVRKNPTVKQVLAISVDGLNPQAIRRLGRSGTPTLHRLIAQGASTLNARTEFERTETLPNHTGMVTGLRIRAARGGHGVEWNDDRTTPRTVQSAARRTVPSVFSQVKAHGGSAALFASKTKFSLWQRSWPGSFDRFVVNQSNAALVRSLRKDLSTKRSFRFLHLADTDLVGHREGYMGREYLAQVKRTDALLGSVIRDVRRKQPNTVIVLTSDHGGRGTNHANPTELVNYRIPFIVWGHRVEHGGLYRMNPHYKAPGTARVGYHVKRQPVRNGDLANLSLDLLGLPALEKSEHDRDQDLLVR